MTRQYAKMDKGARSVFRRVKLPIDRTFFRRGYTLNCSSMTIDSQLCEQHSSDMSLLHLPKEILMKIFECLNNMDVLYSLIGIGIEQLDLLVQSEMFTNTLNFVSSDSDMIYSINDFILDRFCFDKLPRIPYNVRYLIVESINMERVSFAGEYPNLIKLKIFNFNEETLSRCFTGNERKCEMIRKFFFYLQINPLLDIYLRNK